MDSALTPREIQSRIRAGESLDDVARAAGIPVEDIEGYAAPVLAERVHIASLAHEAQVRSADGPATPLALAQAIAPRLVGRGVDPDSVIWDAWREEDRADRHWTVRISYQSGSAGHEALFDFDPRGRSVTPVNSDAQGLVGQEPPPKRPVPGSRARRDPDAEPTIDLNDELALVRAVQDDETPIIAGGSALQELYDAAAGNQPDPGDNDNDLVDGHLEERDGVYDIVPNPPSDMDVLYDMLAGFDEDSVHVYSGLNRPVNLNGDAPPAELPAISAEEPDSPPHLEKTDEPGQQPPDQPVEAKPEPTPPPEPGESEKDAAPEPTAKSTPPARHDEDPHQQPLVKPQDASAATPAPTRKRPRRRRSHRATVPTWDEIMFGEPRPGHED